MFWIRKKAKLERNTVLNPNSASARIYAQLVEEAWIGLFHLWCVARSDEPLLSELRDTGNEARRDSGGRDAGCFLSGGRLGLADA
jgi:hypothetical protein